MPTLVTERSVATTDRGACTASQKPSGTPRPAARAVASTTRNMLFHAAASTNTTPETPAWAARSSPGVTAPSGAGAPRVFQKFSPAAEPNAADPALYQRAANSKRTAVTTRTSTRPTASPKMDLIAATLVTLRLYAPIPVAPPRHHKSPRPQDSTPSGQGDDGVQGRRPFPWAPHARPSSVTRLPSRVIRATAAFLVRLGADVAPALFRPAAGIHGPPTGWKCIALHPNVGLGAVAGARTRANPLSELH